MLSHGRITGCHHHLSLHIQWSRHHHHVMDSIKKLMISQRCFFLAQIKVGESHFDIQKEAAVLVKHRKVKSGLCFYVAWLNVVFFISLFCVGFFFFVFNHEGGIAMLYCFTCCDTRICSWTAINVECSRAENPADKHNKTGWCTLMGLLCCRHGEHGLVICDLLLGQNKVLQRF